MWLKKVILFIKEKNKYTFNLDANLNQESLPSLAMMATNNTENKQ